MGDGTTNRAKMRPELDPAIIERLRDAPPDSAIGRARAFGIDIAALAIRLATTTPLDRLRELDRRIDDIRQLRRGMLGELETLVALGASEPTSDLA